MADRSTVWPGSARASSSASGTISPASSPSAWARSAVGCGELRRCDVAVPALVEGIAFDHEHGFELSRRYGVSWLARCRFDLGQWTRPKPRHGRPSVRRGVGGLPASWPSTPSAGCGPVRGEDDVWSMLDGPSPSPGRRPTCSGCGRSPSPGPRPARSTAGSNLISPAGRGARAGPAVPARDGDRGDRLLARAGGWRRRCRGARGRRALALSLAGDHLGAAAAFRRMGCPYKAARELAATGDVASLREALATFRRLGAAPAAAAVASQLRALGARCRPGGHRRRMLRAATPGRPERTGGRGAQARGGRLQQPPDRHVALHQPQDRRAPHVEHPGQAGSRRAPRRPRRRCGWAS